MKLITLHSWLLEPDSNTSRKCDSMVQKGYQVHPCFSLNLISHSSATMQVYENVSSSNKEWVSELTLTSFLQNISSWSCHLLQQPHSQDNRGYFHWKGSKNTLGITQKLYVSLPTLSALSHFNRVGNSSLF